MPRRYGIIVRFPFQLDRMMILTHEPEYQLFVNALMDFVENNRERIRANERERTNLIDILVALIGARRAQDAINVECAVNDGRVSLCDPEFINSVQNNRTPPINVVHAEESQEVHSFHHPQPPAGRRV